LSKYEQSTFNSWSWENPFVYGEQRAKEALEFLKDPKNLERGITLYTIGSDKEDGRVVFSLSDVPMMTHFETEKSVPLQRTSPTTILLNQSLNLEFALTEEAK